ncbi:MAG: CYTH domain-containing protein [Deltaproteobacteria bacterium]|nr:CYTH domain-containing protein [Deltaproteobacteria bacterium]
MTGVAGQRPGARRAPVEVEAKLLVPQAATLRALARLRQIGPYVLRPRRRVRPHSLYLDTADLALAQRGVALRLRRHGRQWEATAKWRGRVRGFMHQRPELSLPLRGTPRMPFVLPAGPLADRLAGLVGTQPLVPILITEIRRRLFDVFVEGGGTRPVAEMVLDSVRLSVPSRLRPRHECYDELEIELAHGTRRDVLRLARLLQARFDLPTSSDSKFARGLALLHRRVLRG